MLTQQNQNALKLFKQIPQKIKNLEAERSNMEKSKKRQSSISRIPMENNNNNSSLFKNEQTKQEQEEKCLKPNNIMINKSCSQLKQFSKKTNNKANNINNKKYSTNENRSMTVQNGKKRVAKSRYAATSQNQNFSQFDEKAETQIQQTTTIAEAKNNNNNNNNNNNYNNSQFNLNDILATSMSNYQTKENNIQLANNQLAEDVQLQTQKIVELEAQISEYEARLQQEQQNNQLIMEKYENEMQMQKQETAYLLAETQKNYNNQINSLMMQYQQLQDEQAEATNRFSNEQKEFDITKLEEKCDQIVQENAKLLYCLEETQKVNQQKEEEIQMLKSQIQENQNARQIQENENNQNAILQQRLNSCASTPILFDEQQNSQPQANLICQKIQNSNQNIQHQRLSHMEKSKNKSMMNYQGQAIAYNQMIYTQQYAQPQCQNFRTIPNSNVVISHQQQISLSKNQQNYVSMPYTHQQ